MRDAALVLVVIGFVMGLLVAFFHVRVGLRLQSWAVRVVGPDASKTRVRVVALGPPFAIVVAWGAFVSLVLQIGLGPRGSPVR